MLAKSIKHDIEKMIIKKFEDLLPSLIEVVDEHKIVNQQIDSDFLAEEIISEIDVDEIVKGIEKILVDRELTFMVYPSLGEAEGLGHRVSSEYMCSKCYRPHGQWIGHNKMPKDPNILQNGRSIILNE
jgi:hypothetical protein